MSQNLNETAAPHSKEAEEAVIGAALINPMIFRTLRARLVPEDFFLLRNATIWQALDRLEAANTRIDYLTVVETLRAAGVLEEIGGPAYLTQLINGVPTSVHAEVYAGLVRAAAIRRQMLRAADEIKACALDETLTIDEAIARGQESYLTIKSRVVKRRGKLFKDVMSEIYDDFEMLETADRAFVGIPTGLADYDAQIGGMEKQDLIILAGRPGQGKSALTKCIAINAASRQHENHVALFLNEMSRKDTAWRAVAAASGINSRLLKQPRRMDSQQVSAAISAFGELSTLPLYIDDYPYTVEQLRSEVEWLRSTWGVDLVIVDGLYRVPYRGPARARWEQFGEMAQALKSMAVELELPVVVTHQLNRELEKRMDKRPQMSDLAESGRVEQEADVITMLYRDAFYNPDTQFPNAAELITVKNRDGVLGTVTVFFDSATARFINADMRRITFGEMEQA